MPIFRNGEGRIHNYHTCLSQLRLATTTGAQARIGRQATGTRPSRITRSSGGFRVAGAASPRGEETTME